MPKFNYNGRVITAATKAMAVRKALALTDREVHSDKYSRVSSPVAEAYRLLDEEYLENGHLGKGVADSVVLLVENDESLYRMYSNRRSKSRGIAWEGLLKDIAYYLDWNDEGKPHATRLSSEQLKNWFRLNGLDFTVEMKPVVDAVEESRQITWRDNEEYEKSLKEKKAQGSARHARAASKNPGGISDRALEHQRKQYGGKLPELAANKYCMNCGCQLFKEPKGNTENGYPYVCLECDENFFESEVVTGVGKAPRSARSFAERRARAAKENKSPEDKEQRVKALAEKEAKSRSFGLVQAVRGLIVEEAHNIMENMEECEDDDMLEAVAEEAANDVLWDAVKNGL